MHILALSLGYTVIVVIMGYLFVLAAKGALGVYTAAKHRHRISKWFEDQEGEEQSHLSAQLQLLQSNTERHLEDASRDNKQYLDNLNNRIKRLENTALKSMSERKSNDTTD